MKSEAQNVIIINKNINTEKIDKTNNDETNENQQNLNENEFLNIKFQTKIFAVLLMIFAVLLFFALVSHTAKDELNTQFSFTEIFGIFSGEPNIKMKFDTSINLLGLFGAYISDLIINRTIGFSIVVLPIFLFIWGNQLYKIGEISENIVKITNKYLIFATVISFILGSLSNFTVLQNIPLEFYGSIGAFVGTMISKIISPIGATILFTILLFFLLLKLTNIKKNGFNKTIRNFFNNIQIKNFTNKINSTISKNNSKNKLINSEPDFSDIIVQKNKTENQTVNSTVNNFENFSQNLQNNLQNQEEKTENRPNIFYKNHKNEGINLPQNNLQNQTIKNNSGIIDDKNFSDFKGKIKLKIVDNETVSETFIPEKLTVKSENPTVNNFEKNNEIYEKNSENIPENPTVIDEAVFNFQPPTNIELPKQQVYIPPEQINPNLRNPNLNDNFRNENDFLEEKILENQPIKLNFPIEKTENNAKNPKLLIEVDKSEEEIEKNHEKNEIYNKNLEFNNKNSMKNSKNIENSDEIRSGLRNPLSVGIHSEKIKYFSPNLDLLDKGETENFANDEELQRNGIILQEKLQTFKINISNLEVTRGPVVTQYEFVPADGVKINKIEGLADDLAMALKAKSVHIIAPVPEKGTVGIQIPNSNPSIVRFRSVISMPVFKNSNFELPIALGKTVAGEPFIADLAKMPHLLIAGSTGSGKSVGINTVISSLLYKKHPSQLKFVIIDPKKVELTHYARLSNHFLAVSPDLSTEIVTEPQDAITVLKAAVLEMERRYTLLERAKQRNIKDYNEKVRDGAFVNDGMIDHRELPYIVVIVDELADLMLTAGKEVELPIVRLAQMARAVGIHLIIATQRPSVNVITGIIKANFPARIAYLVAQKVDSRTILDSSGAEALLGNGDMLYSAANQPRAIRIQNPFISTDEVERICDFIGNQEGYSEPYLLPSTFEAGNDNEYDVSQFDPLFRDAAEIFLQQSQASTSMLQRRLKIGFARAGRIMDELAAANIIGPPQGSKPRAVLIESLSDLDRIFGE